MVFQRIYQGPRPPQGNSLRDSGIDVVVLCAKEYQVDGPQDLGFPGVHVIRAPSIDAECVIPEHWISSWHAAAQGVAAAVREGKTTLVTCHQGLNRSGVVSALAIHYLTGFAGSRCAAIVQHSREGALFNRSFVAYLSSIAGTP